MTKSQEMMQMLMPSLDKVIKILLIIWQLPQHLLGLLLLLVYNAKNTTFKIGKSKYYHSNKLDASISLGYIIILGRNYNHNTIYHEYGHSIQSKYLGPIYLLIIGLPSILGNIYDRLFHKSWTYKDARNWYYNLPWEKSADELGNVVR